MEAARALESYIEDPQAIQTLTQLSADGSEHVRSMAEHVLGKAKQRKD